MADPTSPALRSWHLAAFALKSSTTLHSMIQSFKYQPKRVRDLTDELETLGRVLGSLSEIETVNNDADLSLLDLPLLRCGNACRDFGQDLLSCTSRSGSTRPSFRDWSKLRYMGDDIDGFRRLLAAYKTTIQIFVCDMNLRKFPTAEGLRILKDNIDSTTADLEDRLQEIDEELNIIYKKSLTNSGSDTVQRRLIEKEQLLLQKNVRISCQLSDQTNQLQAKGCADTQPSTCKDHRFAAERSEDDDEVALVYSVSSMVSAATGSSATLVDEALAAADEFVSLLLGDRILDPLLLAGFNRIREDKLERIVKRCLKLFATDLRHEATEVIEKEAVHLILLRGGYIAHRIRQHYSNYAPDDIERFQRLAGQSSSKGALLEDYLRRGTGQSIENSLLEPDADNDDQASDTSESSASGEVETGQLELNCLDRVKVFMIRSAAYHGFRQNLRDFILLRRESALQDSTRASSASSFSLGCTWRILKLKYLDITHGLRMLSRPLLTPGYERLTWTCGCGDLRYADIRGYNPHEGSKLQARLRKAAAAAHAHSVLGGASNDPRPEDQGHIQRTFGANVTSYGMPPPTNAHATGQVSISDATGFSTVVPPSAEHRFLLVCLTISGISTLEQLSIRDVDNDQYMWDKIRERYHELRGKTLWYQKHTLTRWLSTVSWLSWLVTAIDLNSPQTINFVRFQLVPIAMDIRPWNFHSPSLPPEEEVKVKKTYHYNPCPTNGDPTGFNKEVLHCLWKPGPHLDRFWLEFFPKKLKEMLQYVSSKPEMSTGWGIHVVEGINWVTVICLAFVLVGSSSILGIVYSLVTHDVGGGFGMAAFFGTLPALGIASLHLKPVE